MALTDVVDMKNKKVGELELSDKVFNADVNEGLLHSMVRVQRMNRRAGTACTKGRSEVAGGGAKPWKQKGSGRARAGTSSSPIWVGGGAAFGPKPRQFDLSLNKKVKRSALRAALSLKFKNEELLVVDEFNLPEVKTKAFVSTLEALNVKKSLIVLSEENRNLDLSSRNVIGVKLLKSEGLNVYDILNHKTLILTKDSVGKIEEVLGS